MRRMPFKTKSRKISASEKRFSYLEHLKLDYTPKVGVGSVGGEVKIVVGNSIEDDYSYVKGDLFKTLLLASFVVVVQIVLHLVFRKF